MNEPVELNFKSKKPWLKAVILGFLIGLAVILPGISGATLAIIFGLYSKMIYSFGNIFKQFKKCFLFLLPIGIGIVIGVAVGFFFVREVFEAQPFIVICLFAGLMIGSFPAVKDEIKGVKWNTKRIILFALGILIPISVGIVSIFIQTASSAPIIATPMLMVFYFVLGGVVSITQIIPGLSCSALLMAFGQFGAILASIHFDYLKANPLVIVTLLLLVIGFLIGLVVFSKLLNKLFEKKRDDTFTMIVGLSLGSIVTMFLNPDIYAAYTSWVSVGEVFKYLGIGVVLLAVGFIISYMLVRYQRKINEKAKINTQKETENIKEITNIDQEKDK
ncbi:MAG: DUF368 domain-containing protein [Clostridiales bacterium]|nr:DUF368 domain-containing protein [Clostridiales bacterium]